jgi:hypothetical protein
MNILILVCATAMSAPDCQKTTAIDTFYAPPAESESLAGCFRQGMMFAAQSNLVHEGNYAKIVCSYGQRADEADGKRRFSSVD